MPGSLGLAAIESVTRPSVADQVFAALNEQILSLALPPGAKLSEAEVAAQLGVSRQPVRDAFYRLSKLGFLVIRPQRSTTVSLISEDAVMRARFVRTALEVEIVRVAAERLRSADLAALEGLLAAQRAAVAAQDKQRFHALDDRFHEEICGRAGVGFAWEMIQENKAHTDRVRMLSLDFALQLALDDHLAVFSALARRDAAQAEAAMRAHLGRIRGQIARIRATHRDWFADAEA
jgi:DNA-binding GntR family transcriptional regulator